MNKLLDADNIKHHKRVYVNKIQRKKVNTIVNKITFMFINVIDVVAAYYDDLAARKGMHPFVIVIVVILILFININIVVIRLYGMILIKHLLV